MALFKKMARGGAIASSKKMAPAVGGVVAAKTAQPMAAQAAKMPDQAPLSNLRSSVKSVATNVKTAVAKQPESKKVAVGAALQKKPVGRVVTGLVGKFIKRR
jgi:hypothetical protein